MKVNWRSLSPARRTLFPVNHPDILSAIGVNPFLLLKMPVATRSSNFFQERWRKHAFLFYR
jgi:hypothetical protein